MRHLAAVLSLGFLLAAPSAQAVFDPIGGGATVLRLERRFVTFLQRDGIELKAIASAARRGISLSFPILDGRFDPTIGKGEIKQDGAIALVNERKRVKIHKLVVKTTQAPLVAKVGGSQLKLATAGESETRRLGFGARFMARALKLTAKVATRLNKKLRPQIPFAEGQLIGVITSTPQPLLATILPAGRATLACDSEFVAKLDERFVSLNPVFPAEHVGSTFTLPIIPGGAIGSSGSAGTLRTGGEIELLQLGGGQVFWHEPWLDLGFGRITVEANVQPSPPFAGKTERAEVTSLEGGARTSDPGSRTISVQGARLALTPETAEVFNQVFTAPSADVKPFLAGEAVGFVSFDATGQ